MASPSPIPSAWSVSTNVGGVADVVRYHESIAEWDARILGVAPILDRHVRRTT